MSDSHYRRGRAGLVRDLEPPKRRWRFFVNWLFDSLMPGVPVVSTVGASSLKSPASIWRGVVFVVFIMSTMAIFASNQAHADDAYFAGTVIDQDGVPIEDATVRVNEEVRTTNSGGSFGLHVAESARYAISVSKPGYALDSRIEKPSMALSFTLKRAVSIEISVDELSKGITITDSKDGDINYNTWIELPADALVDSNGNKPNESVKAHIYTYDLANESMPGDMTAKNSEGATVYLESAGAFDAEFVGVSGEKYNLAGGKKATVSVSSPTFNRDRELPTFWYYNEADGKWVEEKNVAVRINNDGRYEGEVSHFSQMNFDWEKTEPACVKYTIEESFFNNYQISGLLYIKAVVNFARNHKKTLDKDKALYTSPQGQHVIYNIPANSTVELYVAKESEGNYKQQITVNAGAPWTGVGVPENTDNPSDPYGVCNGKVTLSGSGNNNSIPTLSEWGLIIFMLMLTTIGVLFTMRHQAMIAATSGGRAEGTPPPVLVPAIFIKALTITGLLVLIGFAIGIWLASSLPTTTDIVGTLISVPIFAYLIHLLMIFKRQ